MQVALQKQVQQPKLSERVLLLDIPAVAGVYRESLNFPESTHTCPLMCPHGKAKGGRAAAVPL